MFWAGFAQFVERGAHGGDLFGHGFGPWGFGGGLRRANVERGPGGLVARAPGLAGVAGSKGAIRIAPGFTVGHACPLANAAASAIARRSGLGSECGKVPVLLSTQMRKRTELNYAIFANTLTVNFEKGNVASRRSMMVLIAVKVLEDNLK